MQFQSPTTTFTIADQEAPVTDEHAGEILLRFTIADTDGNEQNHSLTAIQEANLLDFLLLRQRKKALHVNDLVTG